MPYICDRPCYAITNIIITLITMLMFFSCFYAATLDDPECKIDSTINKWFIYYGLYDLLFGIYLMVFIIAINKFKYYHHILFIIIPNTIIFIIIYSNGSLNLDKNGCNKTKYNFYSFHWIFYSIITFIIFYLIIKIKLMLCLSNRVHILEQIAVENNIKDIITDMKQTDDCSVCYENKNMFALKCNHTFCYDCILKWNNMGKDYCMICRKPFE